MEILPSFTPNLYEFLTFQKLKKKIFRRITCFCPHNESQLGPK